MTEATPRPWVKFKQPGGWMLEDKHGFPIAVEIGEEDAALIVRAVNLFDELVGVLDDLLMSLDDTGFGHTTSASRARTTLARVAEQEKA